MHHKVALPAVFARLPQAPEALGLEGVTILSECFFVLPVVSSRAQCCLYCTSAVSSLLTRLDSSGRRKDIWICKVLKILYRSLITIATPRDERVQYLQCVCGYCCCFCCTGCFVGLFHVPVGCSMSSTHRWMTSKPCRLRQSLRQTVHPPNRQPS